MVTAAQPAVVRMRVYVPQTSEHAFPWSSAFVFVLRISWRSGATADNMTRGENLLYTTSEEVDMHLKLALC